MKRLRLRYVDKIVDRTGKARFYFRRAGKRDPLPGRPGTPDFMLAYALALNPPDPAKAPAEAPQAAKTVKGSFRAMVDHYFRSDAFLTVKPATKVMYRRTIERWLEAEKIGHRDVALMTREHIQSMLAKRADTPAAATNLLKKIRMLMGFAVLNKYRSDDPTLKLKSHKGGTHHSWTDAEVEAYEKRWPIGTRERLVFALLLFTGQRVSDTAKMQWSDIDDAGLISVTQQKTGARLHIPIHPGLRVALTAAKRIGHTIVCTARGDALSVGGLGNFMAASVAAAGLPDRCVTHGVRKAAARRLAEAGCSASEIASITGHTTLSEVERYVKAAEQKTLARSAMGRLIAAPDCQTQK